MINRTTIFLFRNCGKSFDERHNAIENYTKFDECTAHSELSIGINVAHLKSIY